MTALCGEEVSEALSAVALPLLRGGRCSQELWLPAAVAGCEKDPSYYCLLSCLGDRA